VDDNGDTRGCVVGGIATASCFGFNATDSTDALQAALSAPGLQLLRIDSVAGKPWVVRPLFIVASNIRVELEAGVEILAKRDEFHWTNDCLLTIGTNSHGGSPDPNVTNVTLSGYGAVLRMRRADYAVPRWPGGCTSCAPYTKAEWRSGIYLSGVTDVLIEGLTVAESGGDGLIISGHENDDGMVSRNVHIRDCIFTQNYRQGLSVISAVNLLVENTTFSLTNGTAPAAGVDLEPDTPHQQLSNLTFRNCRYVDNAGSGFQIIANTFDNRTTPISVLVDGGTSSRNQYGLTAESFHAGVRGSVVYSGVTVDGALGSGLVICNKARGPLLTLRDITLLATALPVVHWPEPWLTIPPVMMGSCGNLFRKNSADNEFPSFGDVILQNLTVVDTVPRQWLSVSDWNPNATAFEWASVRAVGVAVVNAYGCWVQYQGVNATVPLETQCNKQW
jgi:hypothetical protein